MTWGTFLTYLLMATIIYYVVVVGLDLLKSKGKVVNEDVYNLNLEDDDLTEEQEIIVEEIIESSVETTEEDPYKHIDNEWTENDLINEEFIASKVETDLINLESFTVYRNGVSIDNLNILDPDTL